MQPVGREGRREKEGDGGRKWEGGFLPPPRSWPPLPLPGDTRTFLPQALLPHPLLGQKVSRVPCWETYGPGRSGHGLESRK